MAALIFFLVSLVTSPFKPKSRLEAENAALRQQLIVLQRKVRGRVQFTNSDRLFFIQLYRWCPSVLKAMMIIRPETLVRRIAPLLALEIPLRGRPATNPCGIAGIDLAGGVSPRTTDCRRPWPSTTNANNRSKLRVETTNRSMDAIACAWFRKNVFQPCGGDRPRTMYFDTVDWAASKPSINSSPWIRDAPHFGFSLLSRWGSSGQFSTVTFLH
jgi:hypothetical protein